MSRKSGVRSESTVAGRITAGWALMGIATLFASAIYRLGSRGLATIGQGLGALEWLVLVVLTLVFLYGEGHKALAQRWVPRLIDRARRLSSEEHGLTFRLLAPLYGLSLVGRPGREMRRGWISTASIVVAVLIVRSFPDPWRGITDFAVAAALAWGLVAILQRSPEAFR